MSRSKRIKITDNGIQPDIERAIRRMNYNERNFNRKIKKHEIPVSPEILDINIKYDPRKFYI